MNKFRLLISLYLLTFLTSIAYADKTEPFHLCFKPEKPLLFTTAYQDNLYKKDMVEYKFCLEEFIKDQESDILMHQKAIAETKKEQQQLQAN